MPHNYTNYSTPKTNPVQDESTPVNQEVENENPVNDNVPADDPITKAAEVVPEPEADPTIIGTVVDCVRLRVRESSSSNAAVICEIPKDSEVLIDDKESTDDFYKVCTESGAEGFCMKKFIALK